MMSPRLSRDRLVRCRIEASRYRSPIPLSKKVCWAWFETLCSMQSKTSLPHVGSAPNEHAPSASSKHDAQSRPLGAKVEVEQVEVEQVERYAVPTCAVCILVSSARSFYLLVCIQSSLRSLNSPVQVCHTCGVAGYLIDSFRTALPRGSNHSSILSARMRMRFETVAGCDL